MADRVRMRSGLPGPYVPPAPGLPSRAHAGEGEVGRASAIETGWPSDVYIPKVAPIQTALRGAIRPRSRPWVRTEEGAPRDTAAGPTRLAPSAGPYQSLQAELRTLVRRVPDFPRPGARFWDATPLFQAPDLLRRAVDALAAEAEGGGAEAIAGIDPRGLLLAPPVALRLELPFVPVAAPGTLPGELVTAERRGEGAVPLRLAVQRGRLTPGQRVVIVDDLIQSGSTAATAARLLESVGAIVAGLAFLLEDSAEEGRRLLGRYNVFSLLML